ncbi:MAG: UDP-N-acetylmuramoyl-tripeptide--D-alanyl-D-alanine ligase [bacterium JZ-2024 1]
MEIKEFLAYTGGKLLSGPDTLTLFPICTDTRKIQAGDVFVALEGPNFNGNRFAEEAVRKGAKALILSQPDFLPQWIVQQRKVAVMVCPNSLLSLGILGREKRLQSRGTVLAVTGSVGKTTTKEAIACALSSRFHIVRSPESWNNEIGIPLTFLENNGGSGGADFFVVEMGMRKRGDILYLCGIAQPDAGVITHTAPAHIGLLGSLSEIARAKAELLDALPQRGIVFLNVRDPFFSFYSFRFSGQKWFVCEGTPQQKHRKISGDVPCIFWKFSCWDNGSLPVFSFWTPRGKFDFVSPVAGFSTGLSIAFALSVGLAFSLSEEEVFHGLAKWESLPHRMHIQEFSSQVVVVDDSYNANPASMRAGIEYTRALAKHKKIPRLWAILGDMLELGEKGEEYHRDIARYLKRACISELWAVGDLMRYTVEEADKRGITSRHFSSVEELLEHLSRLRLDQTVIFVKGSRAMRMEKVVEALQQKLG